MTLYELTGQMRELLLVAADPDVDPQVLKDTMEGLEGEFEIKADGYAKVMKELEGRENALTKEIQRMTSIRDGLKKNRGQMKELLRNAMKATGKTKFKTDFFNFWIQKNPPSLKVTGKVPEEWLIPQEPRVDNDGIKKAIAGGASFDWAHVEQEEGVRIK